MNESSYFSSVLFISCNCFLVQLTTEYVGDVDFLVNREYDNGDSIITLLSTSTLSITGHLP